MKQKAKHEAGGELQVYYHLHYDFATFKLFEEVATTIKKIFKFSSVTDMFHCIV